MHPRKVTICENRKNVKKILTFAMLFDIQCSSSLIPDSLELTFNNLNVAASHRSSIVPRIQTPLLIMHVDSFRDDPQRKINESSSCIYTHLNEVKYNEIK